MFRSRNRSSSHHVGRRLPVAALIALALCLGVAVPGAAQEGDLTSFLDSVDVNLVNLEVFVTDQEGNRVPGLTRDDFEVRVDGQPVELTNFHVAHSPPSATAPAPPPAAGEAENQPAAETVPAPADDAAPPAPRRPLFLVAYVDNVHILPGDRKRILDDLAVLLEERVANGDQVMLVGYDRTVKVVQPFTSDPQEVAAGLRKLTEAPTHRQLADTRFRFLIDDIRREMAAQVPNAGQSQVAIYRQERESDALAAYKGLRQVITGLAGLPGRRALLYVSDGIPRWPGAELASVVFGSAPVGSRQNDLRRTYEEVARQANAHEVTLYTFDARGPNSDLFLGADSASVGDFGFNTDFAHDRDANLQEPLMQMADETGGRSILNTNDFAGTLDTLLRDFEDFYSLGFPSPSSGDGEYHNVQVRVKRPGVQVRHREGYLDKSPAAQVADRTESFLLQGWQSNPMGVQLQFAAPEKKRRRWQVPVLVRIPAGSVTLIPRGDEMVGRLQLFVAVRDGEGRVSELTRLERDVSIPREAMEQQAAEGEVNDLGYSVNLEMRPGPQSLVVGVWDEVGGAESYVYQKVVVGGPS